MSESLAEMSERLKAESAAKKKATQDKIAELRAESEAERKAEREQKEAIAQAKEAARQLEAAQKFDQEHKERTRRNWIANGGIAADFEKAWPKLREEIVLEQMQKTEQRRRAATIANYRNQF